MQNFYIYLISSLPALSFGIKPPISYKKFLDNCSGGVSADTLHILENLSLDIETLKNNLDIQPIRDFYSFEVSLRNEIVKIRSSRKHVDLHKYLRPETSFHSYLAGAVLNIHRKVNPIEEVKELDRLRWDFLEQISFGHYFDLEALIVYAYKLLILERWENIRLADKKEVLERILA